MNNETEISTIKRQISELKQFGDLWDHVEKNYKDGIDILAEMYGRWLDSEKLPHYSADELVVELGIKLEELTEQ